MKFRDPICNGFRISNLLLACLVIDGCTFTTSSASHQRAKFEPPDGMVLHGAGQDFEAFEDYCGLLPDTPTAIYMIYSGVRPPDDPAWLKPRKEASE